MKGENSMIQAANRTQRSKEQFGKRQDGRGWDEVDSSEWMQTDAASRSAGRGSASFYGLWSVFWLYVGGMCLYFVLYV